MIVRLRGTVASVHGNRVVIDCGGVGYEVAIPASSLGGLPSEGQPLILHTRQIFREDGQSLVGFLHTEDRDLFDLLTEVKGCGPKLGLQIISDLGSAKTTMAIASEDGKMLATASGVGPRLAERIILELKDKVRQQPSHRLTAELGGHAVVNQGGMDELVDALLTLGYRRPEAEAAASQTPPEEGSIEDRIKSALRWLAR